MPTPRIPPKLLGELLLKEDPNNPPAVPPPLGEGYQWRITPSTSSPFPTVDLGHRRPPSVLPGASALMQVADPVAIQEYYFTQHAAGRQDPASLLEALRSSRAEMSRSFERAHTTHPPSAAPYLAAYQRRLGELASAEDRLLHTLQTGEDPMSDPRTLSMLPSGPLPQNQTFPSGVQLTGIGNNPNARAGYQVAPSASAVPTEGLSLVSYQSVDGNTYRLHAKSGGAYVRSFFQTLLMHALCEHAKGGDMAAVIRAGGFTLTDVEGKTVFSPALQPAVVEDKDLEVAGVS